MLTVHYSMPYVYTYTNARMSCRIILHCIGYSYLFRSQSHCILRCPQRYSLLNLCVHTVYVMSMYDFMYVLLRII